MEKPRKLWFKRKLFGWGWTPASWEGWTITLVYIALVLLFVSTIDDYSMPREVAFMFLLPVFILTISFIRIAIKTGEKPMWQWGKRKEDK